MKRLANVEFSRGFERAAHFLEAQEHREARIKPACYGRVAAPVLGRKNGRSALPGAQAIKFLATVIAELFAPGVNGAAEIRCEMMARLASRFVVTELAAAFERERCAAQRKTFAAVGGKVSVHFS